MGDKKNLYFSSSYELQEIFMMELLAGNVTCGISVTCGDIWVQILRITVFDYMWISVVILDRDRQCYRFLNPVERFY